MRMFNFAAQGRWLVASMLALCLAACGSDAGGSGGDGDGDGDGDGMEDAGGDGDVDAGVDAGVDPLADLTKTHSAKVPPAEGALFGAYALEKTGSAMEFRAREELIGRRWVIDHQFYGGPFAVWINERTRWDVANHIIPLITWEPHNMELENIAAGVHDDLLKERAQQARDLGAEIFLRWGHEMNGNWYPWSGAANGGLMGQGPAKYVAAYKHVHDVFKAEGADNVVWVWCPLVTDVPGEAWNHWTNYYPGDEYVDWIGFDSYNWGPSTGCCVWQSFETLTDAIYNDYKDKGKPLMLPETASAELGGDKAAWIDTMREQLKTKYSAFKAVVWFDIDKETDWHVDSSPATLEAYKRMAHDPWFNPKP